MENHKLVLGDIVVQNVTQRKISILGGTGSGKTTTLKMIAATLGRDIPVYVFDPLNVIRIQGFERIIIGKKHLDQGSAAGKALNKPGRVIFAFKDLLQSEIVQFTNGFFETWQPKNCLIGIDEIHEFTPQTGGAYAPEVERAIRHWRNANVGFAMTSQRTAKVNKDVLALTDYAVIYRTTWTHDVRAIEDLLETMLSDEETKNVISNIQTQPFLNGWAADFRLDQTA